MTINNSTAAARVTNGSKIYGSDETEVRALDDVTVEFEKGKLEGDKELKDIKENSDEKTS